MLNKYNIFKAMKVDRENSKFPIYYLAARIEEGSSVSRVGDLFGSEFLASVVEGIMKEYLSKITLNSGPSLDYSSVERLHHQFLFVSEPLFGKRNFHGIDLECAHSFTDDDKKDLRAELEAARDRVFVDRRFSNATWGLEV